MGSWCGVMNIMISPQENEPFGQNELENAKSKLVLNQDTSHLAHARISASPSRIHAVPHAERWRAVPFAGAVGCWYVAMIACQPELCGNFGQGRLEKLKHLVTHMRHI